MKASCILLALVLISASCSSEKENFADELGLEYFPLELGAFWEYQVDSIIFDPSLNGTSIDTFHSFLKEEVIDTFTDIDGSQKFKLERYWRRADTLPWLIQDVFTMSMDESGAYRTENNLKFIKMVFPLKVGKLWDGHIFFEDDLEVEVAGETVEIFKGWEYQVNSLSESFQHKDLIFEEVASIQNADFVNLIELRSGLEYYAPNVGLIYRSLFILDTQCEVCCSSDFSICENLEWEEKAEKGFILFQSIIDFGK